MKFIIFDEYYINLNNNSYELCYSDICNSDYYFNDDFIKIKSKIKNKLIETY